MDVLVLMGSDSDYEVMQHAVPFYRQFDLDLRMTVASAHRTPERVEAEVLRAEKEGAFVIVCAAGMAAHLAGVVAGITNLPVIGVPLASGALDGLDALLATVQMPAGIPVATVGIGKAGARNAAILCARMVGPHRPAVAQALVDYRAGMTAKIAAAAKTVEARVAADLGEA
jgi:phosphoribosylaminoimidazole carboxylase PurE protein